MARQKTKETVPSTIRTRGATGRNSNSEELPVEPVTQKKTKKKPVTKKPTAKPKTTKEKPNTARPSGVNAYEIRLVHLVIDGVMTSEEAIALANGRRQEAGMPVLAIRTFKKKVTDTRAEVARAAASSQTEESELEQPEIIVDNSGKRKKKVVRVQKQSVKQSDTEEDSDSDSTSSSDDDSATKRQKVTHVSHRRDLQSECLRDTKQLKSFAGNEDEYFDDWFDGVLHKQSCFGWPEDRALRAAKSALVGNAVKIHNSEIAGRHVNTMAKFREKMAPHFKNKYDMRTISIDILNLKRKAGEDMVMFCQRLTTMMASSPEPLSDTQKMVRLENALKGDVDGAILVYALGQASYASAVDILVKSSAIIGVKKEHDDSKPRRDGHDSSRKTFEKSERFKKRDFKDFKPVDLKFGGKVKEGKEKYCTFHKVNTHSTSECRGLGAKYCRYHNSYGSHSTEDCRKKPSSSQYAKSVNVMKNEADVTMVGSTISQMVDVRQHPQFPTPSKTSDLN